MPDLYENMSDEETKSFMEKVKKMRVKEERRNLAKAVLITDHQEARGMAVYTPLTRSLLEG